MSITNELNDLRLKLEDLGKQKYALSENIKEFRGILEEEYECRNLEEARDLQLKIRDSIESLQSTIESKLESIKEQYDFAG